MLSKTTIERILDAATSQGGDFAEVFCEDTFYTNVLALTEGVETSSLGRESGVGIRIFNGLNSLYGYTNDFKEDNLLAMVRQMTALLNKAAGQRSRLCDCISYSGVHPIQQKPVSIPLARKLEKIERALSAGKNYAPEIVQVSVSYVDMEQSVQIANSEGLLAEDARVKTRMHITAFAQNEQGMQTGYLGPGAMRGFEFYDDLDIEWYAREAARIATTMLRAVPCPGGQMPVVIDNGFGGLLFHEACGHSLEASSVAKGTSEFSGKLGERIASPLVTLIDDGSLANEWGSLAIDDEGIPTRKNILIENGILRGYLVDRLNGRRMGMAPTGSARRKNYRFAPQARMTNTYIANGTSTRDEIIANTERGLFVKYINGGSVNPATGEFNFNACESYLIENGKITEPVKGVTLIGKGGNILQQVDMVANNLEIRQGYCYAASGPLYIGAGQPTVRVANMTVGGAR